MKGIHKKSQEVIVYIIATQDSWDWCMYIHDNGLSTETCWVNLRNTIKF
jgi:hypothetical protein